MAGGSVRGARTRSQSDSNHAVRNELPASAGRLFDEAASGRIGIAVTYRARASARLRDSSVADPPAR